MQTQIQSVVPPINSPTLIAGITIRQDEHGRYCLNDLHRASGGKNRHKPSLWLQNKQTIELVEELEIAGIPAIQQKQGVGTYVAKELVYAYATWISAKFHLTVIRTFDAVVTGQITAPLSPEMQIANAVLLAGKMIEEQKQVIAALEPKADAYDLITISEGSMCISNLAKVLEFQRVKDCFAWLHEIHWIFRRSGEWIAHQEKVRDGLLELKTFSYDSSDGGQKTKDQTLVTAKGLAKLSLLRNKLVTEKEVI